MWGLAAHHSNANKQASLVERKACPTSRSGHWEGGVAAICPRDDTRATTPGTRPSMQGRQLAQTEHSPL